MEIQLSNNRENPSLRYKNFMFNLKTKGKVSAAFVCTTSGCYASISLKVNKYTQEIQELYVINSLNENHRWTYVDTIHFIFSI
jgi:hypothetical protein